MSAKLGLNNKDTGQSMSILAFFWSHIKSYKIYYFMMMMAPLVASFYPFAYNYAIKLFLDTMAEPALFTYKNLLWPIGLFLGSQLALEVVWRLSNIAQWKSEPYVRRSILLRSYDYVQNHSYEFFQDHFTGALSSKLKGILEGTDKLWDEIHYGLLQKLFRITVGLAALSLVSIHLTIFVFLWCYFYGFIMYRLSKKLNDLAFDQSQSEHSLIGQISDKMTNIIALFSFASRKRELKLLDQEIITELIPKQVKFYKYNFKFQIVAGSLYLLIFSVLLFYMIHLKQIGRVSMGDFAFVFGITLGVSEDIWHSTMSLQSFAQAMGNLKSALSILTTPQQNLDKPDSIALRIGKPEIIFKNVTFEYIKKNTVLKNLNLTIKAGEKIGLVGHSGAGKSTIVNLLLRYFTSTTGTISIDGQDINQVTQDSLRETIAVIPQDTLLFHRTLMDNIRYGNPKASDDEVIEAAQKAHVHDFIHQLPLGYQSYVGERGIKLSGGQRQRIAIARAILKDAPILVLDEATSSLDSETEKLIQESLNFLIQNKQKTVIAIAHRLSTLNHMDRILVLDKGILVEQGSHEDLMAEERSVYNKLWKLQAI